MNDADIETARLREIAEESEALTRSGNCAHGWSGPNGEGKVGGYICYHCGHTWESLQDRDDHLDETFGKLN